MYQYYDQRQEHTLRTRLLAVADQWSRSLAFFCIIFGFFVGLAFVINLFHATLPHDATYRLWGRDGMAVLGAIYMVMTAYAALYPERRGWLYAIVLLGTTNLIPAVLARSPIGIIFWTLALATVVLEIRRRIRTGEWGNGS